MSLAPRMLALILLAGLAALAVHQHNLRLRQAYEARRLVEEQAELRNEIAWLQARIARLVNPDVLLPRARKLKLTGDGEPGPSVRAPAPSTDPAGN